jgi:hypothetical protein
MIVRISIGHFPLERAEEVAQKLTIWEAKLRPAIQKLTGNIAYYVAIDKEKGYMTNTSLWQSLDDAKQMYSLAEMLEQRNEFETLGVEFIPITNHEVLWSIG